MTIHEANKLIESGEANRDKLLQCLEDLCKEYGYVEKNVSIHFWDLDAGKKALAEIQNLIEQLKEKLK